MGSELENILSEIIQRDGPLPVDQWMSICLGHPDYGYYTTSQPFGAGGDFTTAPEISQMFGELIGLWAAVVWQQMGAPDTVRLIELGPGRGTLMSDALRAASGVPGFSDAISVNLMEISPILIEAQKKALAGAGVPVSWVSDVGEIPAGPSIFLGNEFLDALPVCQFLKVDDGWRQRCIDVSDGRFRYVPGDPVDPSEIPLVFQESSEGSIFETSPASQAIVSKVCERIRESGGAALFIDYGHSQSAVGDTLQAVRKHEYADPLANPGAQDLTAHVDFAALARTAKDAGARAWGPISQGDLLERLGISARAASLLAGATKEQAVELASARQRLTSPDGMGRLFKALAICHPDAPAPPGFEEVSWAG